MSRTLSPKARERIDALSREFASIIAEEIEGMVEAAAKEAAPEELDVDAAAVYLKMSACTLRRRVASREIAYRREGVRLLFRVAALDEYRAKNERVARD